MSSFSFAVISDTHYCTLRHRSPLGRSWELSTLPDYFRYSGMVDFLGELSRSIGLHSPSFLVSTGDLIEGGSDDVSDQDAACALFSECAPFFVLARGSHDAKAASVSYHHFFFGGCSFIVLDYTCWDSVQRTWLIRCLEKSSNASHVFVFGHPPLHLFGRLFFHTPVFCQEVSEILRSYPVDIYFCGHTHNQCVSYHSGLLQVVGSAVGSPDGDVVPLEEAHVVESSSADQYIWGILEDSSPSYWHVQVDGDSVGLDWHSGSRHAELAIHHRFMFPEVLSYPPFDRHCVPLKSTDLLQIRTGWLHVYSANRGVSGFRMSLNGIDLGNIPESVCYASRRFVVLSGEALCHLSPHNLLEIVFPESETFALGSLSLELVLLDGRIIRSRVSPELFVCGNHPDYTYALDRAERVSPGGRRRISVDFR